MTDSIERFNNRVANYVKYRPHYPREIIAFLEAECGLSHESVIADVGCGTGISTALFLENCNMVYGVEPNPAMRQAAVEFLKDFPHFLPINGTSEATTLPDKCVEMIVAAQAFHWFDPETTRPEFKRIGCDGAYTVLIWNERQLDTTPFLSEYEAFLLKYAKDYATVRHENIAADEIANFFRREYHSKTFPNKQVFDFDGLKGRMLSASYMPDETHPAYAAMIDELNSIFAKHNQNGKIEVLYDTNVYFSRL